jgi:hypothetical protein
MKAYALTHKFKELDQPFRAGIQFVAEPSPESRYSTREQAAVDCMKLNQGQVHVGSHCCAFAVDQLPQGDFGIICACHPIHLFAA